MERRTQELNVVNQSESVDVVLLRDNTSVPHDSETNFSLVLKGREGETQGESSVRACVSAIGAL